MNFSLAGKGFTWEHDGIEQVFSKLVHLSKDVHESIRSLISGQGWTFSLYDFHSGLATVDTQYGFPQILAAIWPTDKINILYQLYVRLNYYLIGLSFSIFGFYFKQKPIHVMIGAINYTFCGFALSYVMLHPHCATPMIVLPLLLIGIEKVLHKEKAFLLTFAVFYSMASSFGVYFSFMLAILLSIYVVIRFFDVYQERRLREFICLWGRLCVWAGVGALLSCFTALPTLLSILKSDRVGRYIWDYFDPFIYDIDHYGGFVVFFLLTVHSSYRCFLSFTLLSLPAILLLLLRRERKHRVLLISFLLLSVMLCLPVVGYVMSGFSDLNNRFCFCYAFLVSVILMVALPKFKDMSRREMTCIGVLMMAYLVIRCVFVRDMSGYGGVALAVLLLLVLLACKRFNGAIRKHLDSMLLVITCISVLLTTQAYYTNDFLEEYHFHEDPYEAMEEGDYAALSRSETVTSDESYFRVMGSDVQGNEVNFAFYYDLNALTAYPYYGKSQAYSDWFAEQELPRTAGSIKHRLLGLTRNAPVLSLESVKYYLAESADPHSWPYGFEEVERVRSGDEEKVVLRNQHWLPLGYTYEHYLSREQYDALDAMGKQEAQLQGLVLESAPKLATISEAQVALSARKVPYEILEADGIRWENGELEVEQEGAVMKIAFDGDANTELYLRIADMDLPKHDESTIWDIKIATEDNEYTAVFHSDADVYAHCQHSQLVDMGYIQGGRSTISITFPCAGTAKLGDIEVWCRPMEPYVENVSKLREEVLQNVQTNRNGWTGEITVAKDKLLCLSIPYLDGWKAYVDGKETPLYRANTTFMAIELTAGEHQIEMRYRLPGLRIGIVLSLLGLIGVGVLIGKNRRKSIAR